MSIYGSYFQNSYHNTLSNVPLTFYECLLVFFYSCEFTQHFNPHDEQSFFICLCSLFSYGTFESSESMPQWTATANRGCPFWHGIWCTVMLQIKLLWSFMLQKLCDYPVENWFVESKMLFYERICNLLCNFCAINFSNENACEIHDCRKIL